VTSARKIFESFQSSDGRVKLATLSGIGLLAAALVLVLAVLPAGAGAGDESQAGVIPTEVEYGGGSGACAVYGSSRPEIHINNPSTGFYDSPDGAVRVYLDVSEGDTKFTYMFVDTTYAAFDVIVNGGSKNTWFDNDGGTSTIPPDFGPVGPLSTDSELHAPTKGGSSNLYKLSHINICYDLNPVADLSVEKRPVDDEGNSPDPFLVVEGETVTYEIKVSNAPLPPDGLTNTTATGVVITDIIPTGMEFVYASGVADVTGTSGTIEIDGVLYDTYTWEGQGLDLDPGESITLTLGLRVLDGTGGADLKNRVSVAGAQSDPNAGLPNEAESEPSVTVEATLSGTVFIDANANSAFDVAEEPESLTLRVYDTSGQLVASTTSLPRSTPETDPPGIGDGTYGFVLAPGTYTVCIERRDFHQQTVPDLPPEGVYPTGITGVDCLGLGDNEPVGYEVILTANTSDIDFGNLPLLVCDDPYEVTALGTFTSVEVTLFDNSVLPCGEKGRVVAIDNGANPPQVSILFDGSGTAAGRADILKNFLIPVGAPNGPAETFVPLTYAPDTVTTFADVPWCNVRAVVDGTDEEAQFEDAVLAEGWYPSLLLDSGDPLEDELGREAIVCKVAQFEDITGVQTTVLYFETLDPQFR
jgi:uncharacterized repeat protein (TIGR01451 family)